MPSIKQSVIRIALTVTLGAAALVSGPGAASATDIQPEYWNDRCDYGRACVFHANGRVWNVEHCGVTGLNDFFNYAKAHGNTFRIHYVDGRSDLVMAGTERRLAGWTRAVAVSVYC